MVTNNNVNISQKGKYGSFRASITEVYNKGQYPNQNLNKITFSVGGEMTWKNFKMDASAAYNKRVSTSNRKSVCMTLSLNKLYLYYDVSPLNKVFTTLHRSTQVCVLGSISACKGRYLFGIINIFKNFFCIYY